MPHDYDFTCIGLWIFVYGRHYSNSSPSNSLASFQGKFILDIYVDHSLSGLHSPFLIIFCHLFYTLSPILRSISGNLSNTLLSASQTSSIESLSRRRRKNSTWHQHLKSVTLPPRHKGHRHPTPSWRRS